MIRAGDEVIVVADSTKFGHRSLGRLCGLEGIDRIVVDDGLSPSWQEKLQAANVEVVLAPVAQ
jgi:DeoR family fructose operon transcriptional repressor